MVSVTKMADSSPETPLLPVHHQRTHEISLSVHETNEETDESCIRRFGEKVLQWKDRLMARKNLLIKMAYVLLILAYFCYFVVALYLDFYRARWLFILTMAVMFIYLYKVVSDKCGQQAYDRCITPACAFIDQYWTLLQWFLYAALTLTLVLYIVLAVRPSPVQLISLSGFFLILFFMFIFSKHPTKVKLRPLIWGFCLQFLVAVVILRTSFGYDMFKALGGEVQKFISYTDRGSEFVFGKEYKKFFFVFSILPVIVFFSSVVSVLYYLGVMQIVIGKIAWLMQRTMRTSATESLCAAGNIFIGQTEAPILVRPFVDKMTKSELHAMMTCGFATIAGGVLAAYIMFGVPAEHLICASVMNAIVGLTASKLVYPETVTTDVTAEVMIEKGKHRNILEAAAAGASASISLVANIVVNLIAFLALLAFADATVAWLGSMVGYPNLTLQKIGSYPFMPLAFMLGIPWEECSMVGELLSVKLFLNEFVAYEKLGSYINNRLHALQPHLSQRSEVISTYALCGFANVSAIGIQLGGISPMLPTRRGDLAELATRALITGFLVCSVTACIAGLLTDPDTMAPVEKNWITTMLPP